MFALEFHLLPARTDRGGGHQTREGRKGFGEQILAPMRPTGTPASHDLSMSGDKSITCPECTGVGLVKCNCGGRGRVVCTFCKGTTLMTLYSYFCYGAT